MIGYDAADLTGMIEKVTRGYQGARQNRDDGLRCRGPIGHGGKSHAGATSAMGNISMTGFQDTPLDG